VREGRIPEQEIRAVMESGAGSSGQRTAAN